MFEEISDPDASLVVTGTGVAEKEVRAQIRSDRVRMLGVVDDARLEHELLERTPLRRIGRAEEIAQTVAFLLNGERSGFVTGQSIVVDGGALARLSTE